MILQEQIVNFEINGQIFVHLRIYFKRLKDSASLGKHFDFEVVGFDSSVTGLAKVFSSRLIEGVPSTDFGSFNLFNFH